MAKLILTNLDFNSVAKVVNLPAPTGAADAATKSYVDSAVEGLAWKDSVRVATQSNITISGPGSTIDGVTMVNGDRVLVRSQSVNTENGIYIFNGSAVAMTRSLDASTFDELEQAVVTVEEGTSAGATFRQTAINGTIGSTAVAWTSFGTSAGAASETTAGIAEIATQAETNTGTDDARFLTPAKAKNASWMLRKFAQDIGDGSATSFNIDHNFGTRDVSVQIFGNSGNYEDVLADVQRPSTSRVTVVFAAAPSSNAYRVVVIG